MVKPFKKGERKIVWNVLSGNIHKSTSPSRHADMFEWDKVSLHADFPALGNFSPQRSDASEKRRQMATEMKLRFQQ
jgi:hypothetical protein